MLSRSSTVGSIVGAAWDRLFSVGSSIISYLSLPSLRTPLLAESELEEHKQEDSTIVAMDIDEPVRDKYEKFVARAIERTGLPECKRVIGIEEAMVVPLKWRMPPENASNQVKQEAKFLAPIRHDANDLYRWLSTSGREVLPYDNKTLCTSEQILQKFELDEEWLEKFTGALAELKGSNNESLSAKRYYKNLRGLSEEEHIKILQDAREGKLGTRILSNRAKILICAYFIMSTVSLYYWSGDYFIKYAYGDKAQNSYNDILKTYESWLFYTDQGILNVSTSLRCGVNNTWATIPGCEMYSDLSSGVTIEKIDIGAKLNFSQPILHGYQFKLLLASYMVPSIGYPLLSVIVSCFAMVLHGHKPKFQLALFALMGLSNYLVNTTETDNYLQAQACAQGCNAFDYELTTGASYSIDGSFSGASNLSDLFAGLGLVFMALLTKFVCSRLYAEDSRLFNGLRFFKLAAPQSLNISNYHERLVEGDIVDDEMMPESKASAVFRV